MLLTEPEVQVPSTTLNCTISQSTGKFTLAHVNLIIFYYFNAKLYTYHSCIANKMLLSNYECDYVGGNGTMVCVDMVEVPLHGLYHPRINYQCRPVILAPYKPR